jgi:hypothetical protein
LVFITACGAGNSTVAHETSDSWAGYASAGGRGRYMHVSASWVQPALNCSRTPFAHAEFWAGLDGWGSDTVEQTGIDADCSYGTPIYQAWYQLWPKRKVWYSNVVNPGDKISASVTADGNGHFILNLVDSRERWTHRKPATFRRARLVSAEVIVEAPAYTQGDPLTLSDFGTVSFTGTSANGESLVSGLRQIDMVHRGILKAAPSPMSNGGFTVTWKHS